MFGERRSSHASATCMGAAPRRLATSDKVDDCSGVRTAHKRCDRGRARLSSRRRFCAPRCTYSALRRCRRSGGWLFQPEGKGRTRPAISIAHGYAGVHGLERFARAFAEAGFVVLLHDHRNFGSSDGAIRHDIDPWRQIADWRRAIYFLEFLPEVDPNRIGVGARATRAGTCWSLARPTVGSVKLARRLILATKRFWPKWLRSGNGSLRRQRAEKVNGRTFEVPR